jgi:hypothetical protein
MLKRFRETRVILNAARKPVDQITDRAKRYRANSKELRPAPPKQCGYCGARRNVGVDHISGDESDLHPQNLIWACKSCNGKKAAVMKAAGLGKLTRQYNPSRGSSGGRLNRSLQAYNFAILVARGDQEGDVSKALKVIRNTPAKLRSEYTSWSWARRKAIYGPSGLKSGGAVPF